MVFRTRRENPKEKALGAIPRADLRAWSSTQSEAGIDPSGSVPGIGVGSIGVAVMSPPVRPSGICTAPGGMERNATWYTVEEDQPPRPLQIRCQT